MSMELLLAKMSFMRCEPKNEKFAWRADPAVYPALAINIAKMMNMYVVHTYYVRRQFQKCL